VWGVERPALLSLLILVPFLAWFAYFRKGRGSVVSSTHRIWKGKKFSPPPSLTGVMRAVSIFLSLAGISVLVIALAGPVFSETKKVFLTKGIEMIIVLDESPSMSAPDFRPRNRFESAKEVIKRFVRARENDAIGLVTFGSEAALRVPPTLDYAFLTRTLDSLDIMELGEGTAIGMGIAVSALHLRSTKTKDKVIVLLTDGVNNEGAVSPLDAAASAYRMGIRIYTIGIGGEGEIDWTFADTKSGKSYSGKSGQFDEGLLRSIAEMSGARYFYAGEPQVLKNVFSEIDSLETSEIRTKTIAKNTSAHEAFILAGLILLSISFILRSTACREIL
jgi:Ca-activated chloride channel homolog